MFSQVSAGYILYTAATDAFVLKHQAITALSVDYIFIVMLRFM